MLVSSGSGLSTFPSLAPRKESPERPPGHEARAEARSATACGTVAAAAQGAASPGAVRIAASCPQGLRLCPASFPAAGTRRDGLLRSRRGKGRGWCEGPSGWGSARVWVPRCELRCRWATRPAPAGTLHQSSGLPRLSPHGLRSARFSNVARRLRHSRCSIYKAALTRTEASRPGEGGRGRSRSCDLRTGPRARRGPGPGLDICTRSPCSAPHRSTNLRWQFLSVPANPCCRHPSGLCRDTGSRVTAASPRPLLRPSGGSDTVRQGSLGLGAAFIVLVTLSHCS